MEKKIRVTLPSETFEIIKNDTSDFKITQNFLCNYLFSNYKNLKYNINYDNTYQKKIIQFSLNKNNLENYYTFLSDNNIQIEAKFFRNLFIAYASKSKKNRELFIFKELLFRIKHAIDLNKQISLTFKDNSKKIISPFLVSSSELELKNYLFSYDEDEKKFKNFLIRNIKNVYILNKNRTITNKNFINQAIKNFSPFLSINNYIVVRFSNEGLNIFNKLKTNRPKILEKNNSIYKFECSLEQAKRYFSYFFSEVEILEPLELRNWFKLQFKKGRKLYDV
ncbi:WYL domain-containing protein [Fusobacterium sp. MFO224]|uniref:WYL domain-containing protein n=1 Tax=Fusobacterium sp. MFO224 TaxID=3378070 RepID=UPI0038522262